MGTVHLFLSLDMASHQKVPCLQRVRAGVVVGTTDWSGVFVTTIIDEAALELVALTVVLGVELEARGSGLSAGLATPHPDECDGKEDSEDCHQDGQWCDVLGLDFASVVGGCGAGRSTAELMQGLRLALRDDVNGAGDEVLRPRAVWLGDAFSHGCGGADLLAAGGGVGVP